MVACALSRLRAVSPTPVLAALAFAFASLAPAAAQTSGFAPAAIVNGEVITNYDVDQRARMNAVAAGGAARRSVEVLRRAALEQMINDALRVQAATAAGVSTSPDQISEGLNRVASSNGTSLQALLSTLAAGGVNRAALERQIKAEIAWRMLVTRRYGRRISISDAEVAAAVADAAAAPQEVEYLGAEIMLPFSQGGRAGAQEAARQVVASLGSGGRFSDLARTKSGAASSTAGGDMGWIAESALPPHARSAFQKMQVNQVSPPVEGPDGYYIYGLREVKIPGGDATYTLKQLVIPVRPDAGDYAIAQAQARAEAVRMTLTSCDQVEGLKNQYGPRSGDLPPTPLKALPGPVRAVVMGKSVGHVTEPVRSGIGMHVVMVCGVTGGAPQASEEERRLQARTDLLDERLQRLARGLLQELRRDAVIEYR